MTDLIGQELGHYKITRKLGSGGFADVYLAEHIYLNKLAAVKLLLANVASEDVAHSFLAEARTIAKLEHPHIVRVLDFDIEHGVPYLVMEYAPNGTMRQRHPRGSRLPLSVIVSYVDQIASALHFAHTQRLIHRDVKPENILLGRNNEPLLGDFGAALITHTSIMLNTQNVVGTITYMAPEHLEGKAVAASDQYALAIVVYEWLCGHCPFEGRLEEVRYLQLFVPPPSLLAELPELAPEIEQVMMKALSKQPEQRFTTIKAFADALKRAVNTPRPIKPSLPPLILRSDHGGNHYPASPATETVVAAPPLPPTMPAPVRATPPPINIQAIMGSPLQPNLFPKTVQAEPFAPSRSRPSRRMFIGSLTALATVAIAGSSFTLARLMIDQSNSSSSSGTGTSHPLPTPTPTPVTQSTALTTYTHQNEVFTAAWSPDGTRIASAGGNSGNDKTTNPGDIAVHVWSVHTLQDAYTYKGHSLLVRMVAWSPNGRYIASASQDWTVQVWDADTGGTSFNYTYSKHSASVRAVAWSPDGSLIASASEDGTIQVWDAMSGAIMRPTMRVGVKVDSVSWSPDNNFIACACEDGTVSIWNANTSMQIQTFSNPAARVSGSVAFAPDSAKVVTGDYDNDDSVRIWQLNPAKDTLILPGKPGNQVYTVDWSHDSKWIAAGYQNSQVIVWNCTLARQAFIYTGHTRQIMSVQCSHDSKYVVSASFDKTVKVWSL